MKKTIITLLALAGVASANYSGTFAWEANTTPEFTFSNAPGITLTVTGMKIGAPPAGDNPVVVNTVDFDTASPKANNLVSKALTPATNVGNGGTWSIDFTISNASAQALTMKAITFDAFAYNNDGNAQAADFLTREITFALTGAVDASVVHSFTNVDTDGNGVVEASKDDLNWDNNPTITFSAPLEIAAGKAADFTLTVSKSDSVGCFIGLAGATLVPEPTTATLSLLALAGLAARRRRK